MSALSSSQLARVLRDWLAVEKESTRVWLRTEMDRLVGPLVDSVFARLTNKLAINTDSERIQEESNGSDRGRVKREIEEDCEMSLQNVMDSATQTNEHIGDCVKREIKEEEEDGQIMHIKKEEDEEVSETQINDVDGFAEDNQDGDDGGSRSVENAPMDCVKREIKEEYEDGQMMEIKKEEVGETNEVDLGNTNEGEEADDVNRMSMNNANNATLFARWMRDEVELGEPTRANHELMPISNEPQSNLTNREEDNEDHVNHYTQQQFDETNNNGGIMDIEEKEEVGDGKTRVTDIEELAANEGGDESHSVEGTQIGTTPPHLTRQSQANMNKSARRAKRRQKRKLPQAQVRNEVTIRDSQEDEEKGKVDEVSSRHVKRPRMDTTQPNNAQAEVTRQFPRQTTDEAQSNEDRSHEEGDPMESGQEPIGEQIATECTTNPIQPNLAQPNHHLQCSHCHKSFVSKYKLQRHLRVHTGERPFQCDQCAKQFSQREQLTRHQLIHQNIKNYRCHECDKQFTRKDHLDSHLLIHSGERPFQCRHCDKSFAEFSTRNCHEQAIHLHVKPYRCKQCGHTATERSAIIKHIRVVHFGLPQTIKEQQTLNIVDNRDPRELLEKV